MSDANCSPRSPGSTRRTRATSSTADATSPIFSDSIRPAPSGIPPASFGGRRRAIVSIAWAITPFSHTAQCIAVAVHYRAEVAALQRHPRSVAASLPPGTIPLALSSRTVTLPSYGALNGAVTVVSTKFSGGLEQIVLSAHISGGRPHTGYTLTGFDCAGSTGYQSWAAGVTDAHGSGNLSGHAWTVSLTDEYWLYLSPSSGIGGPGVHISSTTSWRV